MEEPVHIPVNASKKRRDFFQQEGTKGPLLYLFLLCSSLFFAYLIATFGWIPGVLIIAALVGLPMVYGMIAYPRFGIVVFLTSAYFIMFIDRMGVDFPLGTLMDFMELLFIVGFFIQQKTLKNWKIFNGPLSIMILIWIIYNLLEVLNPSAESRLAWLYTVRSVAFIMLMYFVFLYNIRTREFIRLMLKLWILFSLIGALYGLKQEFIGFNAAEEAYLYSDPNIEQLLFIDGNWRKFSIFTDPVAFSYNMVVSAMLCIGLMTGPLKTWKKIVLAIIAAVCLISMLYSGTRGAFVLPPFALAVLAVLRFNKTVFLVGAVAAMLLAVVVFMPTSSQTIQRFQSAFRPSEDASFNVRKYNQKRIQPYILSHPVGGGLGATGAWGQRFAPHSFLASFPPDSGYVRVAVELGWVGLLLFCTLMFMILRTGIIHFYAIRDPELKSYCLSMVLIVFVLNLGNYPQEALVQFPTNVYFYLVTALIVITKRIDEEDRQLTEPVKKAL
ncbi:MAG TPA: O-antigen ligase family protein [Sediminibacterium sp.]|nr:O-antigen ligase family protein [Sediminibacterium sp.]